MEKTRVSKDEKYWYINDCLYVSEGYERGNCISEVHFIKGNYFHTKEEAEAMANKLRAVLKGADVIEMPSEEEIESSFTRDYDGIFNCAFNAGRKDGIEWLKSKIVK